MLRTFGSMAVVGSALVFSLLLSPAQAEAPLGLEDLELIQADAENAAIDVKKKYGGQRFMATLPYVSQSETSSGLTVFFGSGKDWQEVSCLRIVDPALFEQVAGWERGDEIEVTGEINDYWVGLSLLNCRFSQ